MPECGWKMVSLAVVLGGLARCIPVAPEPDETDEDGGRSEEIAGWPAGMFEEQEPNDSFDSASPVHLASSVTISGRVESLSDWDVFDLGPVQAGGRLEATIELTDLGKVSVCLFDDQERLLADASASNPYPRVMDLLVSEATRNLYLLSSTLPGRHPGGYLATVHLNPGVEPLVQQPQVIVLNFQGAEEVAVAGRFYSVIAPFDAAFIDSRYAGRTTSIITSVVDRIRADYQGVGVYVYLLGDPGIPDGAYSTVYFGASNPDLLGIADRVDPYNASLTEATIVYTDTFRLFSVLDPDEDMLAQVLANVTSHEIGHLLGLRHTIDPDGIMDVSATARRLMADQWFKKSPLHPSVAPMGYQDGPAMLSWTVGGQLVVTPKPVLRPMVDYGGPDDFEIPRSWLAGHCSHEHD